MNVTLEPEFEALVKKKVASGRYTSSSEVIQEALRLLNERDSIDQRKQKQRQAAQTILDAIQPTLGSGHVTETIRAERERLDRRSSAIAMTVYVLDSSVVAKLFLLEDDSHQAKAVLQHAIDGHITLLCPMLMLYEVVNAFIVQNIDVAAIKTHIDELEGLIDNEIITIVPASQELLVKATDIAATDTQGLGHISSYDSAFHALALTAGGALLTADAKHARKTKTLFGSVEILADFSVDPAED